MNYIKQNALLIAVLFFVVILTLTQAIMCGLLRDSLVKINELQTDGNLRVIVNGKVRVDDRFPVEVDVQNTFPIDVKVDNRFPLDVKIDDQFPIEVKITGR